MAERMTGAEMVVGGLLREGARDVFGIPGGAILPVYDVFYDSPLRHILCRHEQGAAHAAEGYARASGRVGVCVSTSGPGATNMITGLADAHMDSVPMVALTGQVAVSMLGTDAFQEADTIGMTLPVVKHSYLVKRTEDIPRVLHEAFYLSASGRPGPVLIDLPKNLQAAAAEVEWPEGTPRIRGYRPMPSVDPAAVEQAAEVIERATCPLILVGGGLVKSQATRELLDLVELLQVPVISTLMGLGAVPASHPLNLGMIGMHGSPLANIATTQADVLIGVGVRFDDRVTGAIDRFASQARIIHLDIDPAEIGKNRDVYLGLVGNLRESLTLLARALRGHCAPKGWMPELPEVLHPESGRRHGYPEEEVPEGHISGPEAVRAIYRATGGDALVVTDVGQHQMWAAQHYPFERPQRFITSGGLGTMGFGLPAAMGAAVACPNDLVVLLTGDGGLQMTIQELATIATYRLPVKIAVFNNGYLGMVRQWQAMFYGGRYSGSELYNPNFVKLAEAYGIPGFRADTVHELNDAVDAAIRTDGPALIDIHQAAEENTLPIVPAGKALNDMIVHPA